MKKILFAAASAAMMLFASCQKSPVQNEKGDGFLSVGEFSLVVDEAVVTKADPAGDNYSIKILDTEGNAVMVDVSEKESAEPDTNIKDAELRLRATESFLFTHNNDSEEE